VGKGASVAASIVGVGGMGVAVGIAAFVWAYWVITIGKAVFCMSVTLKVGWAAAPHAVSMVMMSMEITVGIFLFIFSPWHVFLPQSLALSKILLPNAENKLVFFTGSRLSG
jgi:hypothetical protein